MRGFTLLELVVVLVVMALVAAAVTPGLIGHIGPVQVETAAREVAAGLRRTRSDAIGENIDLAFGIDVERHTYAIEGESPRVLPSGIEISLATAEAERLGRTAGAIRFFPDGSSTGGEITLASANGRYVVAVDWLTGRIRIYEGGVPPG